VGTPNTIAPILVQLDTLGRFFRNMAFSRAFVPLMASFLLASNWRCGSRFKATSVRSCDGRRSEELEINVASTTSPGVRVRLAAASHGVHFGCREAPSEAEFLAAPGTRRRHYTLSINWNASLSLHSVGRLSLGGPPLPIQRKLIWIQFLFSRSGVILGLDRLAHHQKRQYRLVTWQCHRVFPNPSVVS